MGKNNNDDIESDEFFQELQKLWDEESQRIDKLLADHPEGLPKRLDLSQSQTRRHSLIVEYCVLTVANIFAALCAIRVLLPDAYFLFRAVGYVILFANAMMSLHCIVALFSSLLPNPGRIGIVRASRSYYSLHIAVLTAVAIVVLVGVSQASEGKEYAMTRLGHVERAAAKKIVDETLLSI